MEDRVVGLFLLNTIIAEIGILKDNLVLSGRIRNGRKHLKQFGIII